MVNVCVRPDNTLILDKGQLCYQFSKSAARGFTFECRQTSIFLVDSMSGDI